MSKRSFGKRRSSILKLDNDFNKNDDTTCTTGILFNKSRGQSRRVSFAETAQVKEFLRDSPRVWRTDNNEEDHNKENEPNRNKAGGVSVSGLESLMNGTIETQSYLNLIECPIPEMSADSFNLHHEAGNQTVREPVDMETTLCVEAAFPPEHSREIRYDSSSFLASLKGKSNSLEPMQLYGSPKSVQHSFSMVWGPGPPVTMDVPLEEAPIRPIESMSFLGSLFGSKGLGGSTTLGGKMARDQEEMEETICVNTLISSHNEHPAHLVGDKTILGDAMGVEETACIGGIQLEKHVEEAADVDHTKFFVDAYDGIEETKCVGMILNSTKPDTDQTYGLQNNTANMSLGGRGNLSVNQTVQGDNRDVETTCIGGILNGVDKENITVSVKENFIPRQLLLFSSNERTQYFGESESLANMEETCCVGMGLSNNSTTTPRPGALQPRDTQGNKTIHFTQQDEVMEETRCIGGPEPTEKLDSETVVNTVPDKTVCFTENETAFGMQETTSVGGILKNASCHVVEKSVNFTQNQTIGMEETTHLGGILKDGPVSGDYTHNQTIGMEETTNVGTILHESFNEKQCSAGQTVDKTRYFSDHELTTKMEETKCIGGITNDDKERQLELPQTLSVSNKTKIFDNLLSGMEETECAGGILDNSLNRSNIDQSLLEQNGSTSPAKKVNLNSSTAIFKDRDRPVLLENKKSANLDRSISDTLSVTKSPIASLSERSFLNKSNKLDENKSITDMTTQLNNSNEISNKEGGLTNTINDVGVTGSSSTSVPDGLNKTCEDDDNTQVCPDITDTEITFKVTNKRTSSEANSRTTSPATECYDTDRTRELTQSDNTLRKIKELLMMSAQKNASKIRSGIIKTPSKHTEVVVPSPTASPAHKRIRLFDTGVNEQKDSTNDFSVETLNPRNRTANSALGIDDETMPECMEDMTDLLSNTGLPHTRLSTTQGPNESRTNSSDNLSNLSAMSNISLVAKPHVIPDGPLSLETFFKLTAKPFSFIKRGKLSFMFNPKIDLDCLEEVMEAELVDLPLVEAKKSLHGNINERQLKNEEKYSWLQKTLEETQPQVFQDVLNGDSDELKELREKMYNLFSCCTKEANMIWKQETKSMFQEAVATIDVGGLKKANGMLEELQIQNEAVDEFISSLDDDLKELEESELLLVDLEEKKKGLESELSSVSKAVEKQQMAELELKSAVDQSKDNYMSQKTKTALRQQILMQLMFTEWNLEEFEEDRVGFSFLDDDFSLTVHSMDQQIKDIRLQQRLKKGYQWVHKKMAMCLLNEAVDKDYLLQKYTDISSLPKMLQEISAIASDLKRIEADVREINNTHKLTWDNNTLSFELWNLETVKMVKLFLKFTPPSPLTSVTTSVQVSVKCQIGPVSETDIETCLRDVEIGPRYIQRLINAVQLT